MKQKISIIEDDPLIRNELKTMLQSHGYEASAPEDFSDVIGQIKAEQPHLIILDIKLPGTSGGRPCRSRSERLRGSAWKWKNCRTRFIPMKNGFVLF